MPTPTTIAGQVLLAVAVLIIASYLAGRLHQWSRRSIDRHEAFREGYDRASQALFHLAIRNTAAGPARPDRPDNSPPAGDSAYGSPRRRTHLDAMRHSAPR